MKFLVLLLALLPLSVFAQACPPAPADPVARDQVRLNWPAVSTWAQGGNIPTPTQITYSVYEIVAGANVKRCTTTSLAAGQLALSTGAHSWVVTAITPLSTPPNVESGPSPIGTKTIAPPNQTPAPPASLSVVGDPTAYEIRNTSGALVASRIGRVELGTLCTTEATTVAGLKYNRVDMRSVDLVVWPSAGPTVVKAWARCS